MPGDAPSKTLLLTRRAEKALVREGKSVLEDRRDLLAHMLVQEMRRTEQLIAEVENQLQQASQLFRRCVLRHGVGWLANLTMRSPLTAITWRVENRLGARYLDSDDEPRPPEELQLADSWATSLELETALPALRNLLLSLLQLAAAENNLRRLIDTFRRTQRRVNALEHIVLPELNTTIKEMEDRMDEMDRDDLVRTLLIKRGLQTRS